MDRRSFLKTTGTLLAAAKLHPSAVAQPPADTRTILPINTRWRYLPTVPAGAHQPGFNDASFTEVTIPHTNIPLPWHSFNNESYEFASLYRRPLNLPAIPAGHRVFVDFEGVMTASTIYLNGTKLGSYKGGYTPFSFELTHALKENPNVLSVEVDSHERPDIPPFGYEVDYLTFGGIYREVALRIVPPVFLENIHAQPKNVLTNPSLDLAVYLDRPPQARPGPLSIHVELKDGDQTIARTETPVPIPPITEHHPEDADQAMGALPNTQAPAAIATLPNLKISLWDLHNPKLYTVHVTLLEHNRPIDEDTRRIGFREATFTDHGFSLNGEIIKLHGLDRHQTFPWVGQAMPARVQRQDARILRHDLHCNIVRTSHYPQSRHFLDACDELGLLVLEEIPGWQHIGPLPWQNISVDNVRRMIRRDWNRPSVILWGVRINESQDDHDFYTRTNNLAHALDTGRQTGGIRYLYNSELLEDVMTMNDFGWPLRKPNHPRYLNTEFVGHTFPTKTIDALERQREHTIRHARVHDQLASDPQYAGGIGWCAFDYTTHANFGSGDRICYHGVMDIFRTPKPAAGFYKSMCEPSEEIVLEPNFHWARNDESIGITYALISSNVEHIKMYTVHPPADPQGPGGANAQGGTGMATQAGSASKTPNAVESPMQTGLINAAQDEAGNETHGAALGALQSPAGTKAAGATQAGAGSPAQTTTGAATQDTSGHAAQNDSGNSGAANGAPTETLAGEGDGDRKQFPHLKYPPFSLPFNQKALSFEHWGDLRFDGYIGGKKVISRTLSGAGTDARFVLRPDETTLQADGADAVRVVLRAEDAQGNIRPFAADAITFKIDGSATLIGDNPFGLIGGTGAVWLRATHQPGQVTLTATHPRLGPTTATFTFTEAPAEMA